MSIKKISEITGYSYATVARALCGKGYCSQEKKEVIFAAASKINYKPNLSARTLRNNCTEKILFGIPDICNAFYFRMIQGATEELEKQGYYPMICSTQHSLKKELNLINLLTQKYADGLMLVSFNFIDENIKAIRESKLPVVITNRYKDIRPDDNFDYVYSDHILGMEMATQHLIDCGCKNIVLIVGEKDEQTSIERTSGYKNMLKKNGFEINDDYVLDGGFVIEKAYDVFKSFYEKKLPIDGIITANDLMCMGLMRFFSEHDLLVFQNIKLVSFDNTDFSANLGITSIDLNQDKIGEYSVKFLMERIRGERKDSRQMYIEPKLIIRNTTR